VRKWIRNVEALENAAPTAKLVKSINKERHTKPPRPAQQPAAPMQRTEQLPPPSPEHMAAPSTWLPQSKPFGGLVSVAHEYAPPMAQHLSYAPHMLQPFPSRLVEPALAHSPDPSVHDGTNGLHLKAAIDLLRIGRETLHVVPHASAVA
jgi:hypothetical protein